MPLEKITYLDIQIETALRLKKRLLPVTVSVKESPVKQQILKGDRVNFLDLPGYIACEKDGRPGNITGVAVVRDPDTGRYNLSWHKVRIADAVMGAFQVETGDRDIMKV